jgi:pectate lyase
MKKFIAIVVSALGIQSAQAVTLPFTDHFAYSDGNLYTVASGVWDAGGSAGTEITVANGAALTSPSGFAAASDKGVAISSSGTARRNVLAFTSTSSGEVYASFLLNVTSVTTGTRIVAYLENTTSSTTSPELGVFLDSSGTIGIGKNATSAGATTALGAGTHLVVVRYTWGASAVADLWLDPSSSDYAAVTAPSPTISHSNAGSISALQYFAINSPSGTGAIVGKIDEVRIGTTWASVTPTGAPPPPPSTNVVITAISILTGNNDGDVELRGTGGTPNGSYEVETSSDITIPLTNWLPSGIHQFDSLGNFVSTNGVTPGTQQRFFAINVTGTNSLPPSPPVILSQPQDRTNSAGTTATFTVGVSGTPPFRYQWFYNIVNPLAGKTNSTCTLNNIQVGDTGGYSVLVSNVAGSVTSVVAQLVVTNVYSAPTIVTQPQSHSVTVSNNTSFGVVATGTQPLFYQWYFNTNNLLTDATNTTLVLNDIQFSDAGDYSVIVSNALGTAESDFATLTVNTNVVLNFNHVGYADYGVNLTGGSGGPTVDVYQLSDMAAYYCTDSPCANNNPAVLLIHGTITLRTNGDTFFGSNKSIIGVGTNAAVIGDIGLYGCSNIIIRNLEIRNPSGYGEDDGISCKESPSHIWVDHCTIHDTLDGHLDVTRGGDFVTVSWCKFYYTAPTGHEDVNLIGGSDSDSSTDLGKLHVTFHHNWWGALCRERMPSVRFGRAHVFNNYYSIAGANNYCARTRLYAEVLVEGNWYENVKNPWELLTTSGTTGKLLAQYNNVGYLDTSYGVQWVNGWYPGQSLIPGTDTLTPASWNPANLPDPDPSNVPPYAYTLDNASDVPDIVTNNCGNGKGPFAP